MAQEDKPEKKATGKPVGLLAIVALLFLGVGAGGGFVAAQKVLGEPEQAASPEEGEAGETEDPAAAAAVAELQERLLPLEPVIVNISGDGYARLLKVKIELECESSNVRDEAEARLSQIRDGILTVVSTKRLADVTDFEGKALLKDDLRDRINQILTTGSVESILFTEFVVQ